MEIMKHILYYIKSMSKNFFSYGKALTSNDERLKDAIQDVFYKILSNPSSLKMYKT